MRAGPLRIALTAGEPAGIGPDLLIAAAGASFDATLVALADPELLAQRAADLGVAVELPVYRGAVRGHARGVMPVLPVPLARPVQPGSPDPRNARAVLDAIRRGVDGCLKGEFDALVTGPVNKAIINDAGIPFTGHTEFIGELCESPHPVMMLTDGALRVALVTTHLPLSEVAAAITAGRLERTLEVVHRDLAARFGIDRPRLLVLGVNPHAGEDGHLGREELAVMRPVIAQLRERGIDVKGPVAADTAFTPGSLEQVDAVVAMYHDQGLAPLKALAFGGIVNVTLGLPIIRTSVDHGTALELAGSGRARADSLVAAIRLAATLAGRALPAPSARSTAADA